MKDGKKTCERCNDDEWPCFFVDGFCRMCQARRRDEQRHADAEIAESLAREPRP